MAANLGNLGSVAVDIQAPLADLKKTLRMAETLTRQAGKNMQREHSKVGDAFKKTFMNMRTIGIAAAVTGLAYATKKALDYADSIGKTADSIGVTTDALQEYRFAAGLAGVEQSELDKSLKVFVKSLGEARAGTGALTTFLQRANPELLQLMRGAGSTEEALGLYFDALGNITTASDRAALAQAGFGRAGVKMVVMVKNGADALNDQRKRAHELGLVLQESLIRNAEKAKDQLSIVAQVLKINLTRAFLGLTPAIISSMVALQRLAPALMKFSTMFLPVTLQGGEAIKERITEITGLIEKLNERRRVLADRGVPDLPLGLVGLMPVLSAFSRSLEQTDLQLRDLYVELGDLEATQAATREMQAYFDALSPGAVALRTVSDKIEELGLALLKIQKPLSAFEEFMLPFDSSTITDTEGFADAMITLRDSFAAFEEAEAVTKAVQSIGDEIVRLKTEMTDMRGTDEATRMMDKFAMSLEGIKDIKLAEEFDLQLGELKTTIDRYLKLRDAVEETNAAMDTFNRIIDEGKTAQEEYNETTAELVLLLNAGKINMLQYAKAVDLLNKKEEERLDGMKVTSKLSETLADETARGMHDAFESLFFDAFKGELDSSEAYFEAFGNALIRSAANIAADMAVKFAMTGAISGQKGAGGWGGILGLFASAVSGIGALTGIGGGVPGPVTYQGPPVPPLLGSYATGTGYVPATGLYKLHEGEQVSTRAMATDDKKQEPAMQTFDMTQYIVFTPEAMAQMMATRSGEEVIVSVVNRNMINRGPLHHTVRKAVNV